MRAEMNVIDLPDDAERTRWAEQQLQAIYHARLVRELTAWRVRRGLERDPAAPPLGAGRVIAAMPVMYAVVPRPTQIPRAAHAAIWAGSVTPWQAIRDCWNAGLRGAGLLPPEGWSEPMVH